jgi:tetratricopeptide (TPR) repeat protein
MEEVQEDSVTKHDANLVPSDAIPPHTKDLSSPSPSPHGPDDPPHGAEKVVGDESTTRPPEDWQIQRDQYKELGDAAFRQMDYSMAVEQYSRAIEFDPDQYPILYSNRSAAYLKLGWTSKAYQDAQKTVQLGFGIKGIGRLAAALQALKRWDAAIQQYDLILQQDPNHTVAQQGKRECEKQLQQQQQQQQRDADSLRKQTPSEQQEPAEEEEEEEEEKDELDDFFDEVEQVVETVQAGKTGTEPEAGMVATDAIQNHKKDLGTAAEQIDRVLQPHHVWLNLNPFHVLDLPHTATNEDIARRYKALSLLLHPDKQTSSSSIDHDRVQLAYDQVLVAKAALQDEHKAKHVRDLIEQARKLGRNEYHENKHSAASSSLEECQEKAVKKMFADLEIQRRQIEQRQRDYQRREQQNEDAELSKQTQERKFDVEWRETERVDKRIGNWREFQTKKKKKN